MARSMFSCLALTDFFRLEFSVNCQIIWLPQMSPLEIWGRGIRVCATWHCKGYLKCIYFSIMLLFKICFYLWLCWVFVAVRRLALFAGIGGCSSLWVSHCPGFSSCGAQALGTWALEVVAQGL